jgi:protein-tyrosine phosphatase
MFTRIHWLHESDSPGRLGIMARPRGNEWLEEEIWHFKKQQISLITSLLEADEIDELGLQQQPALCFKHNIEFVNFPIKDRGIPKQGDKINDLINLLVTKITTKQNVIIHCRMGIGRSSIIAGCVLLKIGYKADDLIRHISNVRGLKFPDTKEQVEWLKKWSS